MTHDDLYLQRNESVSFQQICLVKLSSKQKHKDDMNVPSIFHYIMCSANVTVLCKIRCRRRHKQNDEMERNRKVEIKLSSCGPSGGCCRVVGRDSRIRQKIQQNTKKDPGLILLLQPIGSSVDHPNQHSQEGCLDACVQMPLVLHLGSWVLAQECDQI